MTDEKKTSSLEKLKHQREVLNARIQATEARAKISERKKDIRRKILIGTYYLEQAKKENQWPVLQKIMLSYLSRESDRKLFNQPLQDTILKSKQEE